jgi:hypothetical protein
VPQKQPKRSRLWLTDGSIIRQRPEYPNHVWSYDFVADRTRDGRPFRILNIIDEYSKECLLSLVQRRIRSQDVILALADLFLQRGCPAFIRSDNGPEFIAKKLVRWMQGLEVQPLFIAPGSPWENGYCESFNGKMRYELLNGEIFYSLFEAKVIIEKWREHYNTKRPHSSLGGKAPCPEAFSPKLTLVAQGLVSYYVVAKLPAGHAAALDPSSTVVFSHPLRLLLSHSEGCAGLDIKVGPRDFSNNEISLKLKYANPNLKNDGRLMWEVVR